MGNKPLDSVSARLDFEALLTDSPNPYVVLDPDLRLVWMNDAYLRVTMRRREDILGRTMFDAFPSDPDSESFRLLDGSLRKVLATGEADELALIRYDIAHPDGSIDAHYWSATHTPLLDENGQARFILQHTVDVTELEKLRRFRDEMGLVRRASAVQARNLDLSDQSRRFRTLVEQAPGFIAVLSGPEYRFELANEAYRRLIGRSDVIGSSLSDVLPDIVNQAFVELLDRVRKTGEAYIGRRVKVLLESGVGETTERYLDFIYQPIFGDGDQVSGVFVQGHDVTEEVEAESHQRLLIGELNHRVKNTLAVVQGLAAQSFRAVEGAQNARATFDARIKALSAAHNLLTQSSWKPTRLSETIGGSLEATAGALTERIHMDGPDSDLAPQTSVSLAMIVHELCTNAIKYGALSGDQGRIDITWRVEQIAEGERALTIDWVESGGPAVAEPEKRGFGTRLIEHGMAGERRNSVSMEFAPEGLRCRISAVLRDDPIEPAA